LGHGGKLFCVTVNTASSNDDEDQQDRNNKDYRNSTDQRVRPKSLSVRDASEPLLLRR
jgi:hypothetical protein